MESQKIKKEANYDFRKKLLEVHKPDRRDYKIKTKSKSVPDLLSGYEEITDDWQILIPADSDKILYNAARDLEDYFFVSMGISVKVTDSYDGKNTIKYCVDSNLDEHSYRLAVESGAVLLCGSDSRSAAQAGYYIEDLMNLKEGPYLKIGSETRKPLFPTRMTHSGFGLDMFPNEHIRAIAHAGITAILIFVKGIDKTPHGYLDFNDLIYRANNYGVDVYAYSYMESKLHPDDEGAEEFYENLYGRLFEKCPGLKGVVFVGESCEFPSKDPHTTGILRLENFNPDGTPKVAGKPSPGWWPCEDFPKWIDIVKKVIRKKQPAAEFVFWTYNWGYVEEKYRLELLRNIPTDITLHVTFEMFENVERDGITNRTVDYTLFFEGPGKYFVSEAKLAKERGIKLYSMTNTGGLTWDIGTIPYEPAPYQWILRYKEMIKAHNEWGLCGTMDSHHYGFWPSFISELAKWTFYTPSPEPEETLKMICIRDWGEENWDAVREAFKYFSDGIRNLISTNEDQYGPFRVGPSYPLLLYKDTDAEFPTVPYAPHGGNVICNPMYSYDLSSPACRDKINYEIKCHSKTAELYEMGSALLENIYPRLEERKKAAAADLINLTKFISNAAKTTVNVKEWKKLKEKLSNETDNGKKISLINGLREIGLREIENAENTIPLVEYDSRLGYEPTMEYMCDRAHIEWKIFLTRRVIDMELEELKNEVINRE